MSARSQAFGPINEETSVQGVLVRVGGKGVTARGLVDIGDNVVVSCEFSRSLARDLAVHIYGPVLRFWGTGRYVRNADGNWKQKNFCVLSFEILDDAPLLSVVAALRAANDGGWRDVAEPLVVLDNIRSGESDLE